MVRRVITAFVAILIMVILALGIFVYKAKKGINFYERTPHELPASIDSSAVLLLSKTNGFRHAEAIAMGNEVLQGVANRMGREIYVTEDAGVFNEEQLKRFDLVIWNNVTGKVLTIGQRQAFKEYLLSGGAFVGIHGAGDDSHQWAWYENEVLGAKFSHHPLDPQIQEGHLVRQQGVDSIFMDLPEEWDHSDEWYVFYEPPTERFTTLYNLDETGLEMSGNLSFLIRNKDFGMGDNHPIAWYRELGKGRVFYTAMGHNAKAFEDEVFQDLLRAGIRWTLE